ncbi:trigger factor [Candidatus Erwinia haradaeae]|uniref:Trigger factor n=1 Tax=Candidatus Erwinia haradaeae TaxID=1922217 RepID=A0A803FU00_9GAMM|nr:trigger factor [Candidatus Erwinia haradaeae]VFP88433.1 Trigger factor [Candidatus Erwinia haradaeae]
MKTSIETTQGLGKRITITIDKIVIEKAIQHELDTVAKKIKIDGFRKGKAPKFLVKQRYSTSIHQNILNELMQYYFINAITQKKINPVGEPKYIPREYLCGEDYTFSAEFEVYPEIKIQGLEGMEIEQPISEVTEDDVTVMLDLIRKQRATWEETTEPATTENRVTLDFTGSINNQPFEGNQASNIILTIGKGYTESEIMILSLQENIIGHKAGEKFKIKIKFPEDYTTENLKGKDAIFEILLKKVEKHKLPDLTSDFIKYLGIKNGSIEELRIEVRKNMQRELKIAVYSYIKKQVISGLIKANNIEVPDVLLESAINILKKQTAESFSDNKKRELTLPHELFEEEARRHVQVSLLISSIIHTYDITINEDHIQKLIEEIAFSHEDPSKTISLYKKNATLLKNIQNAALEEEAIELVIKKAKLTTIVRSFQEIMNPRSSEQSKMISFNNN